MPNSLINEKSPYLLQHAENPVDWFPWGEDAFRLARQQNKPIFLSIGYSTCHWCHVMAHESFENADIARMMNTHYINIKVDREERPDIDAIYMRAVQMLTGSGGWPMSVWLTPDLKPFYGGTYFPPQERYGRPGFDTVLLKLAQMWNTHRDSVFSSADEMTLALKNTFGHSSTSTAMGPLTNVRQAALDQLRAVYDSKQGGFGRAPKFPMPTYLQFLVEEHLQTKQHEPLEMVSRSVEAMIRGGIFDQLGGGFARYSTDEQWLVPHFEKMLYDNSQLVSVIARLHQREPRLWTQRALEMTMNYIARDLTHPEGGFYSAEDADSEGKEGTFYLWTAADLHRLLDAEAPAAIACFGVTVEGNFFDPHTREVGQNVLTARHSIPDEKWRARLFEERESRPRPHRDDKIITEWNGLMISAAVQARWALGSPSTLRMAHNAAQFLWDHLRGERDRDLYRRWRDGEKKIAGHQADYAFLVQGLLDLFESTGELRWLNWALELHEEHNIRFWNAESGGYHMTSDCPDQLIRLMDDGDNVIPAGNSIAVANGFRLGRLLQRQDFLDRAQKTLEHYSASLERYPSNWTTMLNAASRMSEDFTQVVVLGDPGDPMTQALLSVAHERPRMSTWVVPVVSGDGQKKLSELLPFVRELIQIREKPTAFVCAHFSCQTPTTDTEELRSVLEK